MEVSGAVDGDVAEVGQRRCELTDARFATRTYRVNTAAMSSKITLRDSAIHGAHGARAFVRSRDK